MQKTARNVRDAMLQWGRSLLAAEMFFEPAHLAIFSALQWGRSLLAAEIRFQASGFLPGSTVRLQWGRSLLAAEIPVISSPKPSSRQASMGPQLVSRGNLWASWPRTSQSKAASMGPQLVSRGNVAQPASLRFKFFRLQWGRSLLAAEIETAWGSHRRPQSFNGAAAC